MPESPQFLFATCQVGAEKTLKAELARLWPDFRFAFSRPGFLTFKLPQGHGLADDFNLQSTFARAYGFSLGKVTGQSTEDCAAAAWRLAKQALPPGFSPQRLHVWQRDTAPPGEHGYEPSPTPAAIEARQALLHAAPEELTVLKDRLSAPTRAGQAVLDCIVVEPRQWWAGYHRAKLWPSRFPGGACDIALPANAVSRAYLKMEEALRWSRLSIAPGDRVVEIGCSPGGSCQALLRHGLLVTGIDPAAVHPTVLAHPNFVHVRKRGADVRRGEFRRMRWLVADMNVAPNYTLDTVEAIVTHKQVNIRGMLLTLKLLEWELAERLPEYLARIAAWGFRYVRSRQLVNNRQEVCVAALRTRPKPARARAHSRSKRRDSSA